MNTSVIEILMCNVLIHILLVTSAMYHFWSCNCTKIDKFLPLFLSFISDTHLSFSHDTVQTCVKEPVVYNGRIWLFGIFRYEFNLNIGFKHENERAILAALDL
jgi:hypothetical protein